jgi:Protein of unknown function (DUF3352)
MRRLVVALTALLVMAGVAVLAGYLLFFSSIADRAARAAPADTALYLNVYLQPSSGQRMNLFGLVGRLPGFADAASMDDKIDELAQRLLGEAGINYTRDVRGWLGPQIAIALTPGDVDSEPQSLLLAAVKDAAEARVAVPRLMARDGATYTAETYRSHQAMISDGASYALLDGLLVVADSTDRLHAAIDADADAAASLADSPTFASAMRTVAADHLASLFVDVARVAGLEGDAGAGGYATAALALTAEPDGVHLRGTAPFSSDAASEEALAAFALGGEPATLARWMPRTSVAELAAFGLQQSLLDLERGLAADAAFGPVADALNQLRAIAALGLGINVDRDLLPLFDGEAAIAIQDLDPAPARGQLLLRPSDPAAARAALDRVRDALADRGSTVRSSQAEGTTVTSVTVPQIGRVAYALVEDVVILAFDPADVTAALQAAAADAALGGDDRYRSAFELAGARRGNELWLDVSGLVDAAAGIFDPGGELRDILHRIGELAVSASASDDQLEIRGVLTVK